MNGGGFHLDGAAIAKIGLGTITNFNDPAIAALNPGVGLPGLAIKRVVRAEKSGTSDGFSPARAATRRPPRRRGCRTGDTACRRARRSHRGLGVRVRAGARLGDAGDDQDEREQQQRPEHGHRDVAGEHVPRGVPRVGEHRPAWVHRFTQGVAVEGVSQ